jgi:LysR family hydrogen peroxide-inducible transcriptional activator
VSKKNALFDKKYVLANELDPNQLWLLEEGHCFRSQVLNLCELTQVRGSATFKYETGNIETLKRMVDKSDGITILPELAVREFSKPQLKFVKKLKGPSPAREVSIVTHRDHIKTKLLKSFESRNSYRSFLKGCKNSIPRRSWILIIDVACLIQIHGLCIRLFRLCAFVSLR